MIFGVGMYFALFMVNTAILALVAFFATYVASMVSRYVSSILSVTLNRLTWRQIRKIGWGNDSIGEVSVNADSSCSWLGSTWLPLPERLAKEITDLRLHL
jgi:hypothetical protein